MPYLKPIISFFILLNVLFGGFHVELKHDNHSNHDTVEVQLEHFVEAISPCEPCVQCFEHQGSHEECEIEQDHVMPNNQVTFQYLDHSLIRLIALIQIDVIDVPTPQQSSSFSEVVLAVAPHISSTILLI